MVDKTVSASGLQQDPKDWSPYMVTGIVILLLWTWYMAGLGQSELSKFDEFLTYDRSLGFSRNSDWLTVYSQNEPSLKKPPLQYWMTALLMESGLSHIVALVLPSMLFALATLFATAFLARVMVPSQPWVMLPAVLLVSSSKNFWSHGSSAMLDSGAMMFSTLGIATMLMAFERPKLWPVFGATVFLAGLQKSPTPLAFLALALVTLVLTNKWQTRPTSEIWKNKTFLWTLGFSLLLGFAWPLFQYARLGFEAPFQGGIKSEMFDRFTPGVSQLGVKEFFEILLGNAPLLRLAGVAGLCALPFALGRPRLLATTGIALGFFIAMWLASGKIYDRYTLLILPLLMVGAAAAIMHFAKRYWVRVILVGVLCLSEKGPMKRNVDYRFPGTTEQFGIAIEDLLGPLKEDLKDGETLVICAMDKRPRMPLGAVSVYVNPTDGFVFMRRPDLHKYLEISGYSSGPLRGICKQSELVQISSELESLDQVAVDETDYVYWTANGAKD